jgi:hypothetical protein
MTKASPNPSPVAGLVKQVGAARATRRPGRARNTTGGPS